MTPVAPRIRRADHVLRSLLLGAIGLGAIACQGAGAAPSGNLPGVTPIATVVPTPSALPVPTPTASTAAESARPRAPDHIVIDDPDLAMTLPVGWADYPVSAYRFIIDSAAKSSGPEMKAILETHLKAIDEGAVRMTAGGPIGGANGNLIIQVDRGDPSLEAAVARVGQFGTVFTNPSSVEERPVTLAIGKAVRRVETHPVAPGSGEGAVPARTVEYIARLPDGRTLWILATGPESATSFEALIDASVMSLRSR